MKGDLQGFDAALADGEDAFVKRRIYLTLERGRDIALRNLFRKVYLAAGESEGKDGERVKRTRIKIGEFGAGIRIGEGKTQEGKEELIDSDEVECLIAGMVYKVGLAPHGFAALPMKPALLLTRRQNLMKGYISREHQTVVLSKRGDAFPGTGI